MKTVKEHLEELPEPYRSEALREAKEFKNGARLYEEVESAQTALVYAFPFNSSKAGMVYWFDFWDELRKTK